MLLRKGLINFGSNPDKYLCFFKDFECVTGGTRHFTAVDLIHPPAVDNLESILSILKTIQQRIASQVSHEGAGVALSLIHI